MRLSRLRDEGLSYVVGAVRWRRERARVSRDLRALEGHLARGEPVPFSLRDLYLTRNFKRIAQQYRLRPWPGRATLFRAAEVAFIYREGGAAYGWERHVLGGVEVVRMPGTHHTLVLGANGEELARSLNSVIEGAQRAAREGDSARPPIAAAAGPAR